MLVEVAVDARGVDVHVGMLLVHQRDALGRRHQHQRAHVGAALALQHVHGGDHGAAGGEHRVDDQRHALVELADKLLEVGHRLQGLLVTRDADHADLGARHHVEHAVEHAQPGAQDGHHGDLLALDLLDLDRTGPAPDLDRLEREVLARLVSQQAGDLGSELAELLGADVAFAHQADLVAHERMADFMDGHGGFRGGRTKTRLFYRAAGPRTSAQTTARGIAASRSSAHALEGGALRGSALE